MRKHIILFTAICCMFSILKGQDEILMTIGNEKVTKAEFERIYHKNNSSSVYDNKTPKEYLDLFVNFKLKVLEAKAEGYDTMGSFIKELNGYRDQLAKPYLQDKQQNDLVLKLTYDRLTTEVNASHIAIKVAFSTATPADTLEAYNKIMSIRNQILSGASFEDMAVQNSNDPSAKTNKGNLGWFSAFRMVYPFENAAYETPVGQISMPVKTRYGYHIIRTNAFRPAMGDVLLAHIMVRVNARADSATWQAAKEKINKYYSLLQQGESFADVARKYSEDDVSAKNGGRMRWLSSGELPPDIEEKVFAIKDSGSYLPPMKSEYGYHIFQSLGKRPVKPFDEMKTELEEKITRDERQKNTEAMYVDKLKKQYGFAEYPENVTELISMLDSSVYENKWDPALKGELIDPVFTIGNHDYSQLDFGNYINAGRKYTKKESIEAIGRRKYDEFVKDMVLNYEKDKLDEKYPEFHNLMEEYHDGILLFNITDDKVWSKAVKDTTGLKQYYDLHKKNYVWQTRADITRFSTKDTSFVSRIISLAPQRASKKLTNKAFNKLVCGQDTILYVEIVDLKFEKGADTIVDAMVWKKGTIKTYQDKGRSYVLYCNGTVKPQVKLLKEARGLVTADYQNELEKEWIAYLRNKYPVVVDEKVLETIK
jgi:peptidyl-prolyl cis-trans isomerase SurA